MAFDPLTDIAALTSELTVDPNALGYGADPAVNAGLINAADSAVQISRGIIEAHEVIAATDFSELGGSSPSDQERQRLYLALTGAGQVNVADPNTVSAFAQLFGAGTVTRPALQALQTRDGSRAEQLFGDRSFIALNYVRQAMGL